MDSSHYQSQLQKLIGHRNGYLSLAALLGLICLIELTFIISLSRSERVILLPPTLSGPTWLAGTKADASYLSQMSRYFVGLMLDVTPANAMSQYQEALKQVRPHAYGPLHEKLVIEADRLNKEHLSTSFAIGEIAIDSMHHQAIVKGELSTYIGNTRTSVRKTSYTIGFLLSNGRWWVTSFTEHGL